ncbi:flavin reductase family protein [Methanospirillum lacunae]|uniref:Flavin reductase family protein n=1 Tax=Methanospirillum lacunae TaxID=668570 RepID=A0A2V2N2C8_9EURY|nr:flavin reductase family protein [Methanospirillum lacunae]PWR73919.1 flavin reductase family protein [Methanospirillum lacunae]
MEKISLPLQPPEVSLPVVIAGAFVHGKENYITLGAFGIMSLQPPIVYISSMKSHYSNEGIRENGFFSVNVPPADLVQQADYCGLVSGRDVDKSKIFTTFYGSERLAPMIEECPVNFVCKVIRIVDLPYNEVFIGEIVEYYASKECLDNDKPDPEKIDPMVLAGPSYRCLGPLAGVAFGEGRAYRARLKGH